MIVLKKVMYTKVNSIAVSLKAILSNKYLQSMHFDFCWDLPFETFCYTLPFCGNL